MSKRRRSKKPNLPKATLDRARKQAGLEPEAVAEKDGDIGASVVEASARRRKLAPANLERSRQRGDLDHETIRALLANPTITVTEEQLREEYQHVLLDLRNMGMLTVVLMVFLVAMAQFI